MRASNHIIHPIPGAVVSNESGRSSPIGISELDLVGCRFAVLLETQSGADDSKRLF
jgi:hypothetical protein